MQGRIPKQTSSARVPAEMAEYLPQASVCGVEVCAAWREEGARRLRTKHRPEGDMQNASHH